MRSRLDTFYVKHGKRLLDVGVSAVALVALSPVLGVVAVLVQRRHGFPILLRQERTTMGGRPFTMYKFRSMTEERDAEGKLLPDEQRLTPFGSVLRETSLDELPELWNVLRGEMSLVGPRPLLHQYMAHYSPEQHRRHLVRPGLTGWAVVNGRNTTGWEERFGLDRWYLENISLLTDLRIILRTIGVIVSRDNVNPKNTHTMPSFGGTQARSITPPPGSGVRKRLANWSTQAT